MNKELKWELAIITACVFFAFVAIIAKKVSIHVDWVFITLFRYVAWIIIWFSLLKIKKQKFKINNKKIWFLRWLFWVIATIFWFVAIDITSSWRATLLNNTYPIFTAIFWFLLFNEKIRINNIISIILCFTWALFVFYDWSSYSLLWDIIALTSWALVWITIHYVKETTKSNSILVTFLSPCILWLALVPFTIHQVSNLDFHSLILLILLWILITIGQLLMTYWYKVLPATKWSIIMNAEILFVLVLSYYFVWEEFKFRFFIWIFIIVIWLMINRIKPKLSIW